MSKKTEINFKKVAFVTIALFVMNAALVSIASAETNPTPSPTLTSTYSLVKVGTSSNYYVELISKVSNVKVLFYVDGVSYRTETIARYCLFGGDVCAPSTLSNGQHIIQANTYDKTTGVLLDTQSITIGQVTPTPTPPTPIPTPSPTPTSTYSLVKVGTSSNYYVELISKVSNVKILFYVDSVLYRTETIARYCLFGGDVCAPSTLSDGQHIIAANTYDKTTGVLLDTQSITIGQGTPTPTPDPTLSIKIMPMGDSITYLSYSYREKLWSLLTATHSIDFVGSQNSGTNIPDKDNEGHNGWSTVEINTNVNSWISTSHPKYVLLHIGTNDVSNSLFAVNWKLSDSQVRLSSIIDKIYGISPNTKILVATIIPSKDCMTSWTNANDYRCGQNALTNDWNTRVRTVVNNKALEGKPVYLVDMYSEAGINVNTDLADAVHPNNIGSDKMAGVWFNHLKTIEDWA